jgi:hypothetical protein
MIKKLQKKICCLINQNKLNIKQIVLLMGLIPTKISSFERAKNKTIDSLTLSQKQRQLIWDNKAALKTLTEEQYESYLAYIKENGNVVVKIYDEPKNGFPSICVDEEYYDTRKEIDQDYKREINTFFVKVDGVDYSKTIYVDFDIKWYEDTPINSRKNVRKWLNNGNEKCGI